MIAYENLSRSFERFLDVRYIFNIRCNDRDLLQTHLARDGIVTDVHAATLNWPISFGHTEEEIYGVAEKINAYFSAP